MQPAGWEADVAETAMVPENPLKLVKIMVEEFNVI